MLLTNNIQSVSDSLVSGTKAAQKRKAVLRRLALLAGVCAVCFLTAHLIMLAALHLPYEDMRLKTDLGGMLVAALLPVLVLMGFAGRRHLWGITLCLLACGAAALTALLPR